jgi:hypothetical protein
MLYLFLDEINIAKLTNLFSSISLSQNVPLPSSFSSPSISSDALSNQTKVGLLVEILKFVLNEMNSNLMDIEDIILENMKHLIIDSPDFFFLIDKLFESNNSQISTLMSRFSLTKNFKLRDKIKLTLQQATSFGLIPGNHEIFDHV